LRRVRRGSGGLVLWGVGGRDPSAESDNSKSEQVEQCMDLEHRLHWLHLDPTHLLYYTIRTGYTWSPLTHRYAENAPGSTLMNPKTLSRALSNMLDT
jgi:hypothetical protein